MPSLEGTLCELMSASRRFFKNTRILHLLMTLAMLGTGVAALILSNGSNGTAQVPYFFSAFISGAWHAAFIIISQVCIYYLADDGSRSADAGTWVRVYSITSSVFVLFNVMGVVFTVVNGMCIDGQMCYYDKYMTANRFMAILLVLLHCVSILFNVFLAKRAHLIDAELTSDISVKLSHTLDFLRNIGKRRKGSTASSQAVATSSTSSLRHRRSDMDTPDLHHVQTDHEGKVMATVEISAMRRKRLTHKRSKSHPILRRNELTPKDIEGHVFSIYSDTEMRHSEERKKKKIGLFRKRKKNRVAVKSSKRNSDNSDPESSADDVFEGKKQAVHLVHDTSQNDTTTSISMHSSDLSADIVFVSPAGTQIEQQQKLIKEQKKLQQRQTQLLEEQRKLYKKQEKLQAITTVNYEGPPPYEDFNDSTTKLDQAPSFGE